ncbi:PucR family transcriptional regulator, partial [Actinomadura darangshiensis]
WLERGEVPLPLDEMVLERFAIAAAVILDGMPRRGDAGLVELVLSAGAGEVERSRALRLLGVEPDAVLRVLAVDTRDVPIAEVREFFRDGGIDMASLGRVHAVLVKSVKPDLGERLPEGVRVGVGPALAAIEAPAAWRRACTALRFTAAEASVVHHEALGALAAVAVRMRDEDIAQVADVAVLDRLAAEPGTLGVLTAFCATGSARQAAARVHRHHSTVAARLAHAEARLGFSFSGPGGRLRLDLALLLRRLRDNPA